MILHQTEGVIQENGSYGIQEIENTTKERQRESQGNGEWRPQEDSGIPAV